ncbi:MAG: ribonuclease Z [Bacteroidales bacterium]|nr:ribonuclease Z [Bacteroidales bacterium]
MKFEITILGSGAATPTLGRHCSAQAINIGGFHILLDCGESTQTQLRYCRQRLQSFSLIFISHLHGDHLWGLPGMLASMHLCGRTEPVDLFAPPGLKTLLDMLFDLSDTRLAYELRIHELQQTSPTEVFRNDQCSVVAFPLHHSVPTYGFIFEEATPYLNIRKEAIQQYNITADECRLLKLGKDLERPNQPLVPNSQLTHPRRPARRYAYCCDTAFADDIAPTVAGVDLLCLESTFDNSRSDLAEQRRHLTTTQAATIAKEGNVKQLLLTHFSARYKDISTLIAEAQVIFPNTQAAADAASFEIPITNAPV